MKLHWNEIFIYLASSVFYVSVVSGSNPFKYILFEIVLIWKDLLKLNSLFYFILSGDGREYYCLQKLTHILVSDSNIW